jgi:hypothetical protein
MPPELTRRELLRLAAASGSLLALPPFFRGCRTAHAHHEQWFQAARPGAVPTARRPHLGFLTLPAGRAWVPEETYGQLPRQPVGWVTDAGRRDAFSVAKTLAGLFPQTGLWPCLWLDPDRPASYCSPIPRPAQVEAARAEVILRTQWERHRPEASWVAPLGTAFPGLADRTTSEPTSFDAFAQLEQWQAKAAAVNSLPNELAPRLMLIPCTRPADSVARMHLICGSTYAGVENPGDVSSVLRSWERRFAAVLVGAGPGFITLAVGAPPESDDHALRIAAEQFALAPRHDAGAPGALKRAADELLGGHPPYTQSSRNIWTLGWND